MVSILHVWQLQIVSNKWSEAGQDAVPVILHSVFQLTGKVIFLLSCAFL